MLPSKRDPRRESPCPAAGEQLLSPQPERSPHRDKDPAQTKVNIFKLSLEDGTHKDTT